MPELAIIGGTGLSMLRALAITSRRVVRTPFGEPSSPVSLGTLWGKEVAFLARHGYGHTIPPHRVNYRANLWALKSLGVDKVIAVAAVGGIGEDFYPTRLAIPDQIIDYTWGRAHTFFEEAPVTHIDFTYPYCQALRERLIEGARLAGLNAAGYGTYGAVQGPRLETAAEIGRLERDGCHMVGMTGMPEAALAREIGLCYATCAVVANWAAGKAGTVSMEDIERHLRQGMERLHRLLETVISRL